MVERIVYISAKEKLMFLFKGLEYVWMIVFIMIVSGIAKEHNLFVSAFAYLQNTFKSNRLVVALISAVGGILPIEGRVTVSAGILDTITCDHKHGREKMGIVDYLATHHYYLWSPMEKTVILPIAAFGLTYAAWMSMVWPLLAVSIAFIVFYIFFVVKEEDIYIPHDSTFKMSSLLRNVLPFFLSIGYYIYQGGEGNVFIIFGSLAFYYCLITQTWDYKKLLKYMNWQVLATVAVAICLGNYFKSQEAVFKALLSNSLIDPATTSGILLVSLIGFVASFLMGSSGKYAAFAVLLAQIFGIQYFVWFFALDYAGYILSPTHKCVPVGSKYFGTPLSTYYSVLGIWCILLVGTASLLTFVR
jgi:hypothetical protein